MSKKVLYLIIALAVIIILGGGYYLITKKGSVNLTHTGSNSDRILFQRYSNTISSTGTADCKNLNISEYLPGGIVNSDGTGNEILKMKDHLFGQLSSQKFKNYYYTNSIESPITQINLGLPIQNAINYSAFNFNLESQKIIKGEFGKDTAEEINSSTGDKYAGKLTTSSDNKYLVYTLTKKQSQEGFNLLSTYLNPYIADSDLIVRNLKDNSEKIVISGTYNRQLFSSLHDFNGKGDTFYTINKDGENFKFIKIDLSSGKIVDLGIKADWNEFFTQGNLSYLTFFRLSPDETKITGYRNTAGTDIILGCVASSTHKVWLIDIGSKKVEMIENADGMVDMLAWSKNSQNYAYALSTCGGCYPDYMDSMIYSFNNNGQEKNELVSEKKSKINTLIWNPNNKEIAYSVYGSDFNGKIKAVSLNKDIRDIIDILKIDGKVDTAKPILFSLADWL